MCTPAAVAATTRAASFSCHIRWWTRASTPALTSCTNLRFGACPQRSRPVGNPYTASALRYSSCEAVSTGSVAHGGCTGDARTSKIVCVIDSWFSRCSRCASGKGTPRTRMCSNRVSSDDLESSSAVGGEAAYRQEPVDVDGVQSARSYLKHTEAER